VLDASVSGMKANARRSIAINDAISSCARNVGVPPPQCGCVAALRDASAST
jgi:hypothetical protein